MVSFCHWLYHSEVGSSPALLSKPSPSHRIMLKRVVLSMFAIHKSIGLYFWFSHITLYTYIIIYILYIYIYMYVYIYIYIYLCVYVIIYINIYWSWEKKKTLKPSPMRSLLLCLMLYQPFPAAHPVGIEKQSDGAHAPLPGHFLCLKILSASFDATTRVV